jgi:hypothetical protein
MRSVSGFSSVYISFIYGTVTDIQNVITVHFMTTKLLEPLGLSLYKYPISNQDEVTEGNPLFPKSGSGDKRGSTKSFKYKK